MPGTVVVASKLPHGLILRVFKMEAKSEPVMGGGSRDTKVALELPQRATVNGVSHPQNRDSKAPISFGYALTPNVDKDLWDLWLSQNADSDMVKNGLIFAHDKSGSTESEAREKEKIRSNLERLDPAKMPSKRLAQADVA